MVRCHDGSALSCPRPGDCLQPRPRTTTGEPTLAFQRRSSARATPDRAVPDSASPLSLLAAQTTTGVRKLHFTSPVKSTPIVSGASKTLATLMGSLLFLGSGPLLPLGRAWAYCRTERLPISKRLFGKEARLAIPKSVFTRGEHLPISKSFWLQLPSILPSSLPSFHPHHIGS